MVVRRAQEAILGLAMLVILLFLYSGFFPVLDDLITGLLPSADTFTAGVLRLFLPIVLVMILYGFGRTVMPQRQGV